MQSSKKTLFFPVTELCFPRLPHPKYMCPSRVEAHKLVKKCSNEELCTFYAHFVTIKPGILQKYKKQKDSNNFS